MMIIISDATTKKQEGGGGGTGTPVGRKQLERFSFFRRKKKGKVLRMTFFRDYSFLFVILRRLSRWPVVVRSLFFIRWPIDSLFFFILFQPKDRLPICVCKDVLSKE
jgi:hypothetical protein